MSMNMLNKFFQNDIVRQVIATLIAAIVLALPGAMSETASNYITSVLKTEYPVYYFILFAVVIYLFWMILRRTRSYRREKFGYFTYIELLDILDGEKAPPMPDTQDQEVSVLRAFIGLCRIGALNRPISEQDMGPTNNYTFRICQRLAPYGLVKATAFEGPKGTTILGTRYVISEEGKRFYVALRKRNLAKNS